MAANTALDRWVARADQVLARFSKRHPDWPQYGERMLALAQSQGLRPGLSNLQYLEALYVAASGAIVTTGRTGASDGH